jgi:regulatory protein
MTDANRAAYLDALKMVSRRELSEAQVRQRLARRGHPAQAIDAAVERLRDERAIDDVRVAEAIARTQVSARKRGELRVRRQIQQAGISPAAATKAAREAFEAIDADELLEASLRKRLRGRDRPADEAEFRRLSRYLIGQGFEPDRVLAALNRRRKD